MRYSDNPRLIGFSTGALALNDWRKGLQICEELNVKAIELSALRLAEFAPLIQAVATVDFSGFEYVSIHLPSSYSTFDELSVLRCVESIAGKGWPLIIHPDVVRDWRAWSGFGAAICVENMDKRKPVGRTLEELWPVFERLPDARFCFDFGHARQVDPTMSQASRLLQVFGNRLQQVHLSDVDAANRHRPLNLPALWLLLAYGR